MVNIASLEGLHAHHIRYGVNSQLGDTKAIFACGFDAALSLNMAMSSEDRLSDGTLIRRMRHLSATASWTSALPQGWTLGAQHRHHVSHMTKITFGGLEPLASIILIRRKEANVLILDAGILQR